MAYTAWSVVAFEQPTAAKWNQLGDNDAYLKERFEDGWAEAGETWTYASADSPTFTFTISGDKTTKYYAGMRIKLTQTTAKYFIITKVAYSAPNTTITVYGGTDYTLTNAAITLPYFSRGKTPSGFPLSPAKWTVTATHSSDTAQASPSASTWYNIGSISISAPIGVWNMRYQCMIDFSKPTATQADQKTTLSTANNSESDSGNTSILFLGGASGTIRGLMMNTKHNILDIAAKTTYYLNHLTSTASLTEISVRGDQSPVKIELTSAYL